MAETECLGLPMIEEEEIIDDDFYEKIQAPKFVDLTAPDPRHSDDDRHWFCFRVGCDQKHEQELDHEAIYKNFVLRVMAARSPNVRLRKALNTRRASANLKCPSTAPPKPRVSRMAFISSLSHKINDDKVRPISKKVAVAATPNAKVQQAPSVAMALTTPRNQRKVSNVGQFRTVQSKKSMTVAVPKSRGIAKALVFHSPKKVALAKTKSSTELNTAMKTLCSAMNKLELSGAKKNGKGCDNTLPVTASRKQFKGREVKSRVFDSLYSKSRNGPEANTTRCLKEKKVKGVQKHQVTVLHEEAENDDSSDMEIEDKSRGGSLERCHESGTSGGDITLLSSSNEENKTNEGSENEERRNPLSEKGKIPETTKRKGEENSMASHDKENEGQLTESSNEDKENASGGGITSSLSSSNEENKTVEGKIPETTKRKGEENSMASYDKENEGELTESSNEDKENASGGGITSSLSSSNEENKTIEGSENDERRNPHSEKGKIPEATKRKGEENSMASYDKENKGELTENDDKENASAPDENIVIVASNDNPKKAIFGSKHEVSRTTHKKSTSTSTGIQVVKYRKLKTTYPKPFKLRTDERGILKEANLDKKVPSPLKERTAKGGNAMRKHQNVNRTSEQDTDNYSSCGERSNQITQENQSGSIQSDNSNCKKQHRLSATTPHRNPGPKLQKPINLDNRLEHGEKAAKELDDNFNRKSQMMQRKVVRPRSTLSRKKEKVLFATPCKLSVIVEKPSNSNMVKPKDASSPASKAAGSNSKPCSRGKRALTVPKEPKFQRLHVPKGCATMRQT